MRIGRTQKRLQTRSNSKTSVMKHPITWDNQRVWRFLQEANGREFARVKTPRGLRTLLRKNLGQKLEGKCFRNALLLALNSKGRLYYCEGFAQMFFKSGTFTLLPHAWVSPKGYEEDWCVDPTWKWDLVDNRGYFGIKMESEFAFKEYRRLRGLREEANTVPAGGLSLLSHPEFLDKSIEGYGITYGL